MPAYRFTNCRLCKNGKLVSTQMTINDHGFIVPNTPVPPEILEVDLKNAIIAPGFIELQTNGALGFHFANFTDPASYKAGVRTLAQYLPSTGVTSFFPTVPTVSNSVFHNVLPFLQPTEAPDSASILGAHVEGPFLASSRCGAHDPKRMQEPAKSSLESIYGKANLMQSIGMVTIAPELPGALDAIHDLAVYNIIVSMGHSAATYEEGVRGMEAGATLLTHCFNGMNPLHHREPGLPGLISRRNPPYFSLIADEIHLHPRAVAMAYRSSPSHCMLVTDSIELSGLPDGLHPGHAQISGQQRKLGNKVTIEGTDTLIGTCIGLDECLRNLMDWANIPIQEAVRCVTENVAEAANLKDRGKLEIGRRADFVILDDEGGVGQTWILGKRVV